MNITSKSNDTVKFIKSLNEKKFRQKFNAYYLEGIKVTSEALDIYLEGAIEIISIAYSIDILNGVNGGIELIEKLTKLEKNNKFESIKKIECSKEVFNYMTDTVTTQGVLVVIKAKEYTLDNIDVSKNIVVLDRLQDLGNIGTIIRTADSFYYSNIVCIKGTGDVLAPKVTRSTMASILRVNIAYVADYEELINYLKINDYKVITTTLENATDLADVKVLGKKAIILGNEASGVSSKLISNSNVNVKIPMNEKVESLNVASAASIMLYTLK